jgi:hypothetical protein
MGSVMTRYITNQELVQCIHDAVELDLLAEPGSCLYMNAGGKTCAIGAALTVDERERLVQSKCNDVPATSAEFKAVLPVVFTDYVFVDHVQKVFDRETNRADFVQWIESYHG